MIQWDSVRVRLPAVFVFVLLLAIVLGLFSIDQLGEVNRASAAIRDHWLQSARFVGDLNNSTSDYRTAEATHLLASSPEQMAGTEREIVELDRLITVAQEGYERIPQGESERALYKRFSAEWSAYLIIAHRVLELSRANQKAEGSRDYMTTSRAAYDAASDTLGQLTASMVAGASEASGRAVATQQNARGLIIGAIILAVLNMLGAFYYITRSITRPLSTLAVSMRSLAANQTDIDIQGTQRRDEIGEMARAVVVFRNNAIELAQTQSGLIQQAFILAGKLDFEQHLTTLQRNFLSMASHEFRTPLTIIDGHAQRLIKMKDGLRPHDIAERAEKVRSAVLRMTNVIDNLLVSSRLFDADAGLYFHPTPVDIANLLHSVCHLHREIWPGAQIVEKLRNLPPTIIGNPQLLFQAFSNLLSNAIKYSPNDPKVSVEAVVESDRLIVITRDNGIGIPEKDRARIFERYHRGSNITGITGTGIGLYLVKMVVSLHGGDVSVTSAEGSGSEFTVWLPIESRSAVTQSSHVTADYSSER